MLNILYADLFHINAQLEDDLHTDVGSEDILYTNVGSDAGLYFLALISCSLRTYSTVIVRASQHHSPSSYVGVAQMHLGFYQWEMDNSWWCYSLKTVSFSLELNTPLYVISWLDF